MHALQSMLDDFPDEKQLKMVLPDGVTADDVQDMVDYLYYPGTPLQQACVSLF